MLGNSVAVAVVVVRTRPRAIPLAMITMRKLTHGFPFLSCMSMRLRLAALRAAGAPPSGVSSRREKKKRDA